MSKTDTNPKHRGRFQAQGGGLEESEPWAQEEPLNVKKALELLIALISKLSSKDFEKKKKAFFKSGSICKRGRRIRPLEKLNSNRNKSKHLFENFLEDRRVYGLNRSYWERLLKKSVPNTNNWIANEFANGQKIYDGNPMYALLLKDGKALRIIQEEPENSDPYITAWVKETEDLKNNLIQELVITLELSGMTKKIALELISLWSKDSTDTFKMNAFISEKLKTLKAA